MYLFSRVSALSLGVVCPYCLWTTSVRLICAQPLHGQSFHTSKGHQVAYVVSKQPPRGWGTTWEETIGCGLGFRRAELVVDT